MRNTNESWLERDKAVLAGVLPRCSEIVADSGAGSYLWDTEGMRYLDFTSGIAVTNTGHCHRDVVEAIKAQVEQLIHTSVTTHNKPSIVLAERIAELCPYIEEPQVFFTNSGAESVDGALKFARILTGKSDVVAFRGAFHGRTIGATSLTTAKDKYWKPYTPLLGGVHIVEYNGCIKDIEDALWQVVPRIGAMIVEPVLGEGGYVVPNRQWLHDLREFCTAHGIILIFDEVQTGIGRTGNWFAAETFGVVPDVLLFAKGIASGLPLGGIVSSRRLMDRWETGTHGSTFGGNPISCASALATVDVIRPLLPRVRERGAQILDRLRKTVPETRGIGYMIGVPFASGDIAEEVRSRCFDDGLLILTCGQDSEVIRLIPPLTIGDVDLEWGVSCLEKNIRKVIH